MKYKLWLCAGAALFFSGSLSFAAQRVEELDKDKDGRKETKVYYENDKIVKMAVDQNGDKKPDGVVYYKNGIPNTAEKDADFDGKVDTWIKYDSKGLPELISRDRYRKDGKSDYWLYLRNSSIYMREWDRNFDGKPDFRTYEREHKLLEKRYDDNFDGKFEKIVKAPGRGSTGRIKTTVSA